jgi:hypothetical protein
MFKIISRVFDVIDKYSKSGKIFDIISNVKNEFIFKIIDHVCKMNAYNSNILDFLQTFGHKFEYCTETLNDDEINEILQFKIKKSMFGDFKSKINLQIVENLFTSTIHILLSQSITIAVTIDKNKHIEPYLFESIKSAPKKNDAQISLENAEKASTDAKIALKDAIKKHKKAEENEFTAIVNFLDVATNSAVESAEKAYEFEFTSKSLCQIARSGSIIAQKYMDKNSIEYSLRMKASFAASDAAKYAEMSSFYASESAKYAKMSTEEFIKSKRKRDE